MYHHDGGGDMTHYHDGAGDHGTPVYVENIGLMETSCDILELERCASY